MFDKHELGEGRVRGRFLKQFSLVCIPPKKTFEPANQAKKPKIKPHRPPWGSNPRPQG